MPTANTLAPQAPASVDTLLSSWIEIFISKDHSIVVSGSLNEVTEKYYPVTALFSRDKKDGTSRVCIKPRRVCHMWDEARNLAVELEV
jgi:hypothetical protein